MISRTVKLNPNKKQDKILKSLSTQLSKLYNTLLRHAFDLIDLGQKTLSHFGLVRLCREQCLALGIATDIVSELCSRVESMVGRWQKSEKLKYDFWQEHGENSKPLKAYLKKAGSKLWGKPRFKTKGSTILFSVRDRDQNYVRVFGKQTCVWVPNVGRIKGHNDRQDLLGLVQYVSIKRDSCGTLWAGIVCDGTKPKTEIKSRSKAIGVDLGLKHTATTANDLETIQPIRDRFLDKQLKALKKASNKDRRALPFIHRKIARRRKHSHHVLAKKLVEAADIVYIGNLSSKWLFSGKHARSALDAGHYQLKQIISYKAENAGKKVVMVNEAGSTVTCYKCGHKEKMGLKDREFICSNCGYQNDRDVNGALNIFKTGESLRLKDQGVLEASQQNYGTFGLFTPIS